MNRITYLSIALLVTFFLPWFNLTFFTISGFDLPTSLDKLSNISNFLNNDKTHNLNFTYILYLIPIVSIINVIGDFNKKNRNKLFNEFSIGLLTCIYIIYILLERNINLEKILSIGFYLTFILCMIALIIPQKGNQQKNEIQDVEKFKSTEIEVKKDLFSQIEKLHKLNADGVINDDVFNFEKNVLLKKIDEINLNVENHKLTNVSEINENAESFFKKYQIIFILIIIAIISIIFYNYKNNKIKINKETTSTKDTINNETEGVLNTDLPISVNKKHYLEILKKYLEQISKDNNEIKKVFIDEKGDLETENIDGHFLSVYGLSDAEIFSGDVNSDGNTETIIVIKNSGGGGGGNVELTENYLIVNDKVVSEIDQELINAPENEFGYNIYLTGIKDGYININFIFRNKNDGFYSQGKEEKLKCKLVNNKLKVEH